MMTNKKLSYLPVVDSYMKGVFSHPTAHKDLIRCTAPRARDATGTFLRSECTRALEDCKDDPDKVVFDLTKACFVVRGGSVSFRCG